MSQVPPPAVGYQAPPPGAGKPQTLASVVSEMEAAVAISYPFAEKSPTPLLFGWIEDQAERYGTLVSNYRSIGIVPPISRKPASQ